MKTVKNIALLFTLLGITITSFGQFTLSGEFRPRMEYGHGYKTLADSSQKAGIFVGQRSRLNLDFKTEGYQTRLVLQDIRIWGSTAQLNTSDAFSSIHEAWGQAFLNDKWSLKFGRQEIIYDDHRIFGNVDWAQQARSHDAILFKYSTDKLKFDIGGAYNQTGSYTSTSYTLGGSYKAMQYIWFHKPINDNLKVSLLALNLGYEVSDGNGKYWDNYQQTFGTHTEFKKGKLGVNFNGYYQTGATPQFTANSISAYDIGLDLSYKISDNFSAALGYELLSGNSQVDTTADYIKDQHAFNPYFGTNHKFNGFMDYFYVGNHSGSVGLQDIFAKLAFKKEKHSVGLDFHMFSAANDVLDGYKVADDLANASDPTTVDLLQKMNRSLGMEFDLSFGTQLSEGVTLKAGYSQMIGTETLAYIKGVTDYKGQGRTDQISNWGYVMIIVKPKFFSTESKE
ncbi:MAG: hypothetical protein H6598_04735 [Flavobacteriales bacterium]|nr:hypothetical protein [Flavobacteriales bacterium]